MKSAREWFRSMPTNNLLPWIEAIQKDAEGESRTELSAWHEQFGTAQLSHAIAERDNLRKALMEWENREGSVCPEGVPFEKVIEKLRAQLEAAQEQSLQSLCGEKGTDAKRIH